MSLVELALKKMQAAARSSAQAPDARRSPPPIGQLETRVAAPDAANAVSAHRTDKIITVDRRALRAAGLLPPEHQEQELADQYRHIKRPLISAIFGRGAQKLDKGQLIMMASAMPGEGKTFSAINLALSMTLEKDFSVLLIDADVAKPHISRTFGVESEPGLLDVLREKGTPLSSVILPTDVPKFSIMPAGHRSSTAAEMLASDRMEEVIKDLAAADASRIVLIDSAPLLLASEPRVLAHWVGQVVMVVRAGFTPHQAVLDAIGHLGDNKAISLLLNQSNSATPMYYGYGYDDPAEGAAA